MAAGWCGRPLPDDRDGWKARALAFLESLKESESARETAESVAQMAAHDRDEALQQAADFEKQYDELQGAARSILWMAREYAEAGGRGGPEMQDYEAAAEIIERG